MIYVASPPNRIDRTGKHVRPYQGLRRRAVDLNAKPTTGESPTGKGRPYRIDPGAYAMNVRMDAKACVRMFQTHMLRNPIWFWLHTQSKPNWGPRHGTDVSVKSVQRTFKCKLKYMGEKWEWKVRGQCMGLDRFENIGGN